MKFVSLFFIVLFLLVCFIFPMASILNQGLLIENIFDSQVLATVKLTLSQALISTLISLLIGLPLGLWVARSHRISKGLHLLLALPFGVPTLVAALAWISLLGRHGLLSSLGWAYSLKAVILAQIFFNIPWIALLTAETRRQISDSEFEVAKTLGANSMQSFFTVTRAHLFWPVLGAASQVFSFCTTSFALILILGGGPPIETLETSIFTSLRYSSFDLSSAIAFALWQTVLNLLPWCAILLASSKALPATHSNKSKSIGRIEMTAVVLACSFFLLPYFLPLFQMKWDLKWSDEISRALMLSIAMATLTAIFTVGLSLLWIFSIRSTKNSFLKNSLSVAASLPSSVSILVLGLGFYLAYSNWINPFEGSFLCLVLLQITIFFPIAFRWLWPLSLGHQREIYEGALSLGASPIRAFLAAEWPRWKTPIFSVAAMIAGASMGEVAAVSLFYSEKLLPFSVLISRLSSQYRFDEAQTLSAFLLFLSLGAIVLLKTIDWSRQSASFSSLARFSKKE